MFFLKWEGCWVQWSKMHCCHCYMLSSAFYITMTLICFSRYVKCSRSYFTIAILPLCFHGQVGTWTRFPKSYSNAIHNIKLAFLYFKWKKESDNVIRKLVIGWSESIKKNKTQQRKTEQKEAWMNKVKNIRNLVLGIAGRQKCTEK